MADPVLSLFELQTWQGTRVVADDATGALRHAHPSPGLTPVLAFRPAERRDLCILFAGASGTVPAPALAGDPDRHAVVTLALAPGRDGAVTLRQPVSNRFVCAVVAFGGEGDVVADRVAPGEWEQFQLVPAGSVPPGVAAAALALVEALPWVSSAPAVLHALRTHGDDWRLRPLLRLLRNDDVAWLGRLMRRDPAATTALARVFPADPWAVHALPDLARLPDGPLAPGFVRVLDRTLDPLAAHAFDVRHRSLPQALALAARRDRAPTRQLCLVTTARNEGLYLLEWIAFHQALGVEAFFIYTNDNADGSDDLLRALAACGVVNVLFNETGEGVSPQYKAYGHAFQLLPEILDHRWAGVIDLDEFIVVDQSRYASIPGLLAEREGDAPDAVVLNWVMFGPDRKLRRGPEPLAERFSTREAGVNPHVKAISRPHHFLHAHAHYPIWDERERAVLRGAAGQDHPAVRTGDTSAFSPAPDDRHAFVAHFFTKSAEEFLLRRSFNRGDLGRAAAPDGGFFSPDMMRLFTDPYDRDGAEPDPRVAGCVPDLRARIAQLRALPGVDEAMATVERTYAARLRAVSDTLAADPRFAVPGSREEWFLRVAGGQAA